ncbi:MAG: tRNA threonylcarbamoyladenosine dehydratase [Bacillota bacterium]|nr:tRNA threonylcarbamoyladenosine dehydratase [Bacillota bacterium]
MLHEFSRTELLLGRGQLEKLKRSCVAVFGIGGVGSYAVEGLARAGVGRFILVDGDDICLTNINRQIHATHKTIGRPKVDVMKERILEINPKAEVKTHKAFVLPDDAESLIREDIDYIMDAVDTVSTKIEFAVLAKAKGIPIISCMGAGNKLDPARFEVADIFDTSVCPLCKVMRNELRKRGVSSLKVVYSREEPISPSQSSRAVEESCTHESGAGGTGSRKKHPPGSISFVPSVAGLIMAGEVVKDLIKK